MAGFDKQQKQELGQIVKDIVDKAIGGLCEDVIVPSFQHVYDSLEKINLRIKSLEEKVNNLEEKTEDLKTEVMFIRRSLKDLENNSVETVSFRNLQARVTAIEFKLGV